jgi:uncharacterized protein (TIGR00255 family)
LHSNLRKITLGYSTGKHKTVKKWGSANLVRKIVILPIMLLSMTGFGRTECDLPGMVYSIEIKSLNSKQLDTAVKLPLSLRDREAEIRNMINSELQRGKIEIGIYAEAKEGTTVYSINGQVVREYIKQLRRIAQESGLEEDEHLLQMAMQLPDVMKSDKEFLGEEDWGRISQAIRQAIDEVVSFRTQEGRAIEEDISLRVHSILGKLAQVEPYEEERINRIRRRLSGGLEELSKEVPVDPNRLEQEMILYLDKMDITEEKVRLRNHCKYFMETLKDDPSVGKKLGFITQEMGREINTLGSKAADSDIQRLVVEMKDELEKIREQVLNVL